jgi:hypothetical protein
MPSTRQWMHPRRDGVEPRRRRRDDHAPPLGPRMRDCARSSQMP